MVVRIAQTNVCGSDLHVWRGDMGLDQMGLTYGMILGHEMVGRVARLGAKVSQDALGRTLAEGDRVAFTTYLSCNHCRPCLRDLPHACMMAVAASVRSCEIAPHFVGGFADYYYVKQKQRVFKIPDEVPDDMAAGANCALSQVIHGLDLAQLRLGDYVVVQGAGGLGLFACAVAKEMGAEVVIAVDAIASRLELAKQLGADHVIDVSEVTDKRGRVSMVERLTGGAGADVVVEVAGLPEVVPEGIRMLARGGRYLEMGNVSPRQTYKADPSLLVGYNRSIIGVSLYPPSALDRALRFLARARDRYPFDRLASHRYPLEQIDRAFTEADGDSAVTRAAIVTEAA